MSQIISPKSNNASMPIEDILRILESSTTANPIYTPFPLPPLITENITIEMLKIYQGLAPTKESQQDRIHFIQKIQNIMTTEFPDREITAHLFGSSINNLGTVSSDVDVCLMTDWVDYEKGIQNMNVLAAILRKHGMTKIYTICNARVPIVRFIDPALSLPCDMNVNTRMGLHNTHFIRMYTSLDQRVIPLLMIIKFWTKRRDINNAGLGGTLGSYCWVLMAIFYLQNTSPPVLPVLHKMVPYTSPRIIINNMDCTFCDHREILSRYKSANTQSLGSLLYGFFRFYAVDLDYNRVISVREGTYLSKEEKGWHEGKHFRLLCVEEPFNQSNIARTADVISVHGLQHEFAIAMSTLESSGNLNYVCRKYISSFKVSSKHSHSNFNGKKHYKPRLNGSSDTNFIQNGRNGIQVDSKIPFSPEQLSEHFPTFASANSPTNKSSKSSTTVFEDDSSCHSSPVRCKSVDENSNGKQPLWSAVAQRKPFTPSSPERSELFVSENGTSYEMSKVSPEYEEEITRQRSHSQECTISNRLEIRAATFSEVAKHGRKWTRHKRT